MPCLATRCRAAATCTVQQTRLALPEHVPPPSQTQKIGPGLHADVQQEARVAVHAAFFDMEHRAAAHTGLLIDDDPDCPGLLLVGRGGPPAPPRQSAQSVSE